MTGVQEKCMVDARMPRKCRCVSPHWKLLVSVALALVLVPAPAAWATQRVALLDSANTKEYFSKHYPVCSPESDTPSYYLGAEEYQRYFRGWEYVLQQMGNVPYEIIHDEDVTRSGLQDFTVLILSNTASLSNDQTRAIALWVRRGGRLLATFGAGYKSTDLDVREADLIKLQEGGVGGLHELWHDPLSGSLTTSHLAPGVDVRIDRYEGPTACLADLTDNLLPYGAQGNLLIQRPDPQNSVLASLVIDNPSWTRRAPAIIATKATAGFVVYFAFAPEYLVSKEYDLPKSESCPDGQNWAARSQEAMRLMTCTLQFLLSN